MIVISTLVYDLRAPVFISSVTGGDISSISRRAQRVQTLDGGCVLADYGYSDTDRTLSISARLTKDQLDTISSLVRDYQTLLVSTDAGAFIGSLSLTNSTQGTTLNLLVTGNA